MKKIKENKNLKYSLFFGFYLIFFIILFILYNNSNNTAIEKAENSKKEVSIYEILKESIKEYYNSNYQYKIIINNQEKLVGFINKPNYDENRYSYFFDLYNLNQLIKNAKLEKKEDNKYYFIISNKDLNDILNTEKSDHNNEIILDTKDNKLIGVKYDLSNYFDEKVIIEMEYIKGDSNENSVS